MSVVVGQRNVADTPANKMFYAVDQARSLSVHTIRICANPKIFDDKYQHITARIVDPSMRISQSAWAANNVLVKCADDWKLRKSYQQDAARSCNLLLSLIDLAKSLYHLRYKKVKYWAAMTIEVRGLLRKWCEADQKRYGILE